MDCGQACGVSCLLNVDPFYPQKAPGFNDVLHRAFPQCFFNIYNDLRDLLGFPRSYYYY